MTKTKKAPSAKAAKAKSLVEEMQSFPVLGHVITFGSRCPTRHKHTDVKQALIDAGLDPSFAKPFDPRQAFSRACNQLKEERVIDVVNQDKDKVMFQFSKRKVDTDAEEGGDLFKYEKEAKITLDKASGEVRCKNSKLQEQAQKELDRCMEERTTSDVTKIVQALFDKNADLMPLPGAIGVYFVLKEYTPFVDQIKLFLEKLGRRPHMLPVPSGTSTGDKTVQDTVEDYLKGLLEEHQQAVDTFSISTRKETIENAAQRIVKTRQKIEAYATYLSDKLVTSLLDGVETGKKKLIEKVQQLDTERAAAPQGTEGKDRFGCKLGGTPAKINAAITDDYQTVADIATKCAEPESKVKKHMEFWAERGCFEESKQGWRIKPNSTFSSPAQNGEEVKPEKREKAESTPF